MSLRLRTSACLTALAVSGLTIVLSSCGGGGGGALGTTTGGSGGSPGGDGSLSTLNFPVSPLGQEFLSAAEVNELVARAVQASVDRNVRSTIAITDRVGNVLAVYQMTDSSPNTLITSGNPGAQGKGLDGTPVPSTLAALAKAITGAYLSSTGNAFSTRTASQIVQEFFQPGEVGQPSGPLFGVQFSQLPCSDLNVWLSQSSTLGPKRSPLGLSADPGGFPIYQNGRVIGGIGVVASPNASTRPVYGFDSNILDLEVDLEEEIAFAALSESFRPPEQIRANRITAGGQTFQFINRTPAVANTASALTLSSQGAFQALPGYKTTPVPIDGTAYGTPASGFTFTTSAAFAALDAFNLVTNPADAGSVRYPPRASADGQLSQAEVTQMLTEALKTANRARAQIRNPLGSVAQVTISVVGNNGEMLGQIRSADAPVFGTDVSLQKARSALTFSAPDGLADLQRANNGVVKPFVDATNTFFNNKAAALDGSVAFTARAIGNLHRPYFPDGQVGQPAGPLSTPLSEWSPFNVGFQLNLVAPQVLGTLGKSDRAVVGGNPFAPAVIDTCVDSSAVTTKTSRFANGMQIFPGGSPIYKGNVLVGAIGVSGDGVDQDDMIGYLGVFKGGQAAGTTARPFPQNLSKADNLSRGSVFLKYVQCPQAPYVDSSEQNVCPSP